jgi:hypothetical protein
MFRWLLRIFDVDLVFVHTFPHWGMPFQNPRSLKHEYELYVEREIEDYKDSIPRSAILKIGDEAVARSRRKIRWRSPSS